MSLINDVKIELKLLETGKKKLRSFGLLVGGIFLLISAWIFYSIWNEAGDYTFAYIFLFVGGILFLLGAILPLLLKIPYIIWMGLAFTLGWVVSRILIIILFYLIVTPTAVIAKLLKKQFLDKKFKDSMNSYWVSKNVNADYKKMY